MNRKDFEAAAAEAFESLPKKIKQRLKNVVIVVEPRSRGGELTGLYEGVPLTERSTDDNGLLPDRITLFQRDIEEECEAEGADIRERIARVLRHEIAHYFGISDERLEDLGAY